MRRFVGIWLLLASVYLLGRAAISLVGFRLLDLRFVTFLEVLFTPALQAALFCTLVAPAGRLRRAVRSAHRGLAAWFILTANALLVILGAVLGPGSWAQRAMRPAAGLQVGIAAILLFALAIGPAHSRGERVLFLVGALALAAWCAESFFRQLAFLPDRAAPALPQVLRWLAVYGGIFAALLALLLSLARVLERRSVASGVLLDLASVFALAAAAVVVPNIFLRPIVPEPWATVVRCCALLAAGSVLLALVEARSAERNASDSSSSPAEA